MQCARMPARRDFRRAGVLSANMVFEQLENLAEIGDWTWHSRGAKC